MREFLKRAKADYLLSSVPLKRYPHTADRFHHIYTQPYAVIFENYVNKIWNNVI